MAIFGGILAILGSIFLLLASIGMIRMPDTFNRMQTGTKATTLGTMLFLTGVAFAVPAWTGKLILLIVFVIFTNPLSSHILARAAHFMGYSLGEKEVVNALREDEQLGVEK